MRVDQFFLAINKSSLVFHDYSLNFECAYTSKQAPGPILCGERIVIL